MMRKSAIDSNAADQGKQTSNVHGDWFDLEELATVEITSEDLAFPIEQALGSSLSTGWKAAAKGPQFIRLNFDKPASIKRIQLRFVENAVERCQEFAIYAKSEPAEMREVVRQQFTFSPGGATEETEEYTVDLSGVTSLELRIDPDRAHDPTHSQHFATLQCLRLG